MSPALWITWERQRRSIEMARQLDVPLHLIETGHRGLTRYWLSAWRTLALLRRERPRVVFAQNPSVLLAALVCAVRPLFGYRVIVDRHSNFDFADTDRGLLNRISNYSLRRADLTIVTNTFLERLVADKGGRGFILQDPLPVLASGPPMPLKGRKNVVFVCTYKPDEPVAEVLEAARRLPADVVVHVTGNDKRLPDALRATLPANVVLTGFLSQADYDRLMASANLVLELTTRDHTLLCGAYEALSVGTPLVISNMTALVEYFRAGVVVTTNDAPAIAAAIDTALAREDALRAEIATTLPVMVAEWRARFAALRTAAGL